MVVRFRVSRLVMFISWFNCVLLVIFCSCMLCIGSVLVLVVGKCLLIRVVSFGFVVCGLWVCMLRVLLLCLVIGLMVCGCCGLCGFLRWMLLMMVIMVVGLLLWKLGVMFRVWFIVVLGLVKLSVCMVLWLSMMVF